MTTVTYKEPAETDKIDDLLRQSSIGFPDAKSQARSNLKPNRDKGPSSPFLCFVYLRYEQSKRYLQENQEHAEEVWVEGC